MKYFVLAAFAIVAFAGNSLLARLALGGGDMGAIEFTLIRLGAGAITLFTLLRLRSGRRFRTQFTDGTWRGAISLLVYAVFFSVAYLKLETGTGALVLFAAVQFTIIGQAIISKQISTPELVGAAIAFGGFVYLVFPSVNTPSVLGFAAMAISGIGWGMYTILGRSCEFPLRRTSGNFIRAAIVVSAGLPFVFGSLAYTMTGLIAAVVSGAITSGIGYAIWYAVVPKLSPATSASIQLLVPILAALLGLILLRESLTLRLAISGIVILIGLATTIHARQR